MDESFFRYADIAGELYRKNAPGITHRRRKIKGFAVDDMIIKRADNVYGKKVGRYVLIDAKNSMEESDADLTDLLSRYLTLLARGKLRRKRHPRVLVVGLGNKDYNPDSLGPKVVDRIEVNYHLREDEITRSVTKSFVSAFAPGVMAATGLESSDMIKAIVQTEKIDLVIAVDALATRTIRRLNRVIQLTDTGISPGSGVGNHRKEVDENYLGIPVIAIGVATVIDTAAIVLETLRQLSLDDKDKDEAAAQVMESIDERLVMATKDIDREIVGISAIVASAINDCFI